MNRYNLVDEPWISVLTLKGVNKEVSLKEFFAGAQTYRSLAGETETQNFAVLRLLLAITQTVFSRYDANGKPFETLKDKLDEKMQQVREISESEYEKHEDFLYDTWNEIWHRGTFPEIIGEYLDCWHDRFFLFSSEYPFYQVIRETLMSYPLKKAGQMPTQVLAKQINRTISESENKIALFSPRSEADNNKDIMTESELVRWLITFQGYFGTADKRAYKIAEEMTKSKGWIYDIGGIYLTGENLFETLMLNTILDHPEIQYKFKIQKPCWEYTGEQLLAHYLKEGARPDNLAELYTNWSRAVSIDPDVDMEKPFSLEIVKLPEISHVNNFLEPMTLWQFNKKGANRNKYTPRKHKQHEALWRSFGAMRGKTDARGGENRQVGIIEWYMKLDKGRNMAIRSVTMLDDGNAKSRMPIGQVSDQINMNHEVGTDLNENGWTDRISELVDLTQEIVDVNYKKFVDTVGFIRFSDSKNGRATINSQTQKHLNRAYFAMDAPFKEWLANIKPDDNKEGTVKSWKLKLRGIIEEQAKGIMENASDTDYIGRENKEGKFVNIPIAYDAFKFYLDQKLK